MSNAPSGLNPADVCASEPIHIPGSIQPHGFLFALDRRSGRVVQSSASAQRHLGMAPDALLGRRLADLLDDPGFDARLQACTHAERAPYHIGPAAFAGHPGAFDIVVHRVADTVLAEFEPATPAAQLADLGDFVGRTQQCASIDALCELAVGEIHRLTGYGRVVSYEFDTDGHGRVNGEWREAAYPSFLNLHFPAGDVPAQARRLYVSNRLRCIPDTGYEPSPLLPLDNPLTGEPTDLSFAGLRSVSPMHVRYMRDMGMQASMSLSLVAGNRLWGMIACHHLQPRPVPFAARMQCNLLAQIVSLQIEARLAQGEAERRQKLQQLLGALLAAMVEHDSLANGLASVPGPLLDFVRASGVAVVQGDDCVTIGQAPPTGAVLALRARLAGEADPGVFHTRSLAQHWPEFDAVRNSASGLLAVPISELHPNYIMWFRPEQVRNIQWAGGPPSSTSAGPLSGAHRNFAVWQEVVRGQSTPWEHWELDSAGELRTAIGSVVLRKAEELAELAAELGRTNQELEAFSYSVSHDLRAPLRHIAGYADLLREYEGAQLSERGSRYLGNISDSARFAGNLVDALLTFSQMGRSALRPSRIDLGDAVAQVRHELAPDLQERKIQWVISPDLPAVFADAAYIHLAMRNLLSNAVKYTRGRDPAIIEIGAEPRDGGHVVHVRDNGVGFDMKYVGKLFGVFQRLHRMEEFEGTGIGLANVRRIVERHGGRVWAEGAPGQGAAFYLYLPGPPPPSAAP
ncbi:ATP-binding protein, partial [Pigmentiphaga humi]|uniref:ATP-binding protein n=1 Tax=Pigmentiphaga humi TaxID=2478468 RepID=UPI000F53B109